MDWGDFADSVGQAAIVVSVIWAVAWIITTYLKER